MNADEKLIAFVHGALGDESCDHLVVPRWVDMDIARFNYYHHSDQQLSFIDWLKEKWNGRDPLPDELEIVDEI